MGTAANQPASVAWAALGVCTFSLAATAGVAMWAWRRRATGPATRNFALLALAEAAWNAGHAGELIAASLAGKIAWDGLQTIPTVATALLALMFAAEYTTRPLPRWLAPAAALLALPPTVRIVVGSLFGGATGLRASARLEPPYAALIYDYTSWDLWYTVQVLVMALLATGLLLTRLVRQPRAFRWQTATVTAALALPMVAGFAWLAFDLRLQGERDVTHVTFAISSLLVGWALARGRLFDLVPVARDAIFDNLTDAVLVLDRARRIVDANHAASILLGARAAALAGQSAADALAGWPALLSNVDRDEPWQEEIGSGARWYDARWSPLADPQGTGIGGTLVVREVTELHEGRVALEQRLRKGREDLAVSEGRFRTLFDQTFQLMGLVDRDGVILAANRAVLNMIGTDEASVVGQPLWLTPWWAQSPDQQRQLKEGIARAARGEFVRFQATHVEGPGKRRYIDFSLMPVTDAQGRVVQIIPEGRDVTLLQEARERAAVLAQQLQQAQKMEAMGRLAGGVAHDFNNLLLVISASVAMARDQLPADATARGPLDDALQAADTAAAVTRQLLTFSRKQPATPRRLEIATAVADIDAIVRRLAGPAVEVARSFPGDLWPIYIDPAQLQQALINLVVNARDAMPEGGMLFIAADNVELSAEAAAELPGGRAGAFVRLTVRDTGHGMTDEVKSRIFEPFFTTKPEGKGTGLGLPVVHGVVHQSGGFMGVVSAPGRGTSFVLYIPRA
jgi:PAS domain S-box-containing protein